MLVWNNQQKSDTDADDVHVACIGTRLAELCGCSRFHVSMTAQPAKARLHSRCLYSDPVSLPSASRIFRWIVLDGLNCPLPRLHHECYFPNVFADSSSRNSIRIIQIGSIPLNIAALYLGLWLSVWLLGLSKHIRSAPPAVTLA
ncbi:hypothetical protein BDW72DRAFT_183212 [Aspergillus terricola var. indicus]